MKLGSETGSVVNHLLALGTTGQPAPTVGMGATLLHWSDREPATVTAVEAFAARSYTYIIEVQEDKWEVASGSMQDGSAKYEFRPDPAGTKCYFRCDRATGKWRQVAKVVGQWYRLHGGDGLRLGRREKYIDPSF